MKPITFPLTLRMSGADVANLQAALRLLLDRSILLPGQEAGRRELSVALQRERAQATYGPTTRKVVAVFQELHRLRPTGDVDGPTAEALNGKLRELGALEEVGTDVLPEYQHLVRGQVRYEDGLPLAGLKVQAFDKHLRKEQLLSEATTDAEGRYEIYYSVEELRRKGQRTVSLLVRVLGKKEGEEQESVLAESDIIFEASVVEKINLRIPGGIKHVWSEYEQLQSALEPLLEGAPIASLAEDEKQQDISYLSGKLHRDAKVLAQFARKRIQARKDMRATSVRDSAGRN